MYMADHKARQPLTLLPIVNSHKVAPFIKTHRLPTNHAAQWKGCNLITNYKLEIQMEVLGAAAARLEVGTSLFIVGEADSSIRNS